MLAKKSTPTCDRMFRFWPDERLVNPGSVRLLFVAVRYISILLFLDVGFLHRICEQCGRQPMEPQLTWVRWSCVNSVFLHNDRRAGSVGLHRTQVTRGSGKEFAADGKPERFGCFRNQWTITPGRTAILMCGGWLQNSFWARLHLRT